MAYCCASSTVANVGLCELVVLSNICALGVPGAALTVCEQVMLCGIVGVCDVADGIYFNIPGFAGQWNLFVSRIIAYYASVKTSNR